MWHIIALSCVSLFGWFVNSYPPDTTIAVTGFFILLPTFVFATTMIIFHRIERAILISVGITVWLLLRMGGLREWYYSFLLLLILISLEILTQKR